MSMKQRNVLLVALERVPDEELRVAIATRKEVADVNVLVVAPALAVGRFQALTGAVDEARAEAEELADQTAHAVDAEVRTEVGDCDPVVAVEDALREFPAEEILLAGWADGETEAELNGLGLPIAHVGSGSRVREVARGHGSETPVRLLLAVPAVVLGAIALFSLFVFLAVWLA
jgi:hypothetical protein